MGKAAKTAIRIKAPSNGGERIAPFFYTNAGRETAAASNDAGKNHMQRQNHAGKNSQAKLPRSKAN